MSGVNKVILVGNLGKDPEVRFLNGGGSEANAVCTLRLACNERRKDGDTWKDHVEWMDVVVWGKTAEAAGQNLSKGSQIYVEGRLQTRQFKDKSGADRWRTEVVANQVVYLGGKGGGEKRADSSAGTETPKTAPADQGGFDGSDMPF